MKLKEIKSNMAIHCQNKEEFKELCNHCEEPLLTFLEKDNISDYVFYLRNGKCMTWGLVDAKPFKDIVVELQDLIIDEELTAAEAVKLKTEMCNNCCSSSECIFKQKYSEKISISCNEWTREHPEEVIESLKQYKKNHYPIQPKEPEIEWGYEGNGKFFYTEEEARKYVEEYAIKSYKETGKAMMYYFDCIKACRVKEN